MRQYTTPEQTAKLIELGFEKPKSEIETQWCNIKGQPMRAATIVGDYSIGELIEMLPDYAVRIQYHPKGKWWWIGYDDGSLPVGCNGFELCDALYEFILSLKACGRL